MKKALTAVFFMVVLCYALMMADLFFRIGVISSGRAGAQPYNWVPLRTILAYLSGENGVSRARVLQNLAGNIAAFVPLGLYLQTFLKNKRVWFSLLIVCGVSVAIESAQLAFSLGAADIDDVLLNLLGGMAGVAAYRLLRLMLHTPEKTKTAVEVFSLAAGIPFIWIYASVLLRRLL